MKASAVARSASHSQLAIAGSSPQAQTTTAGGTARATPISQASGGGVRVRCGSQVKRKPIAKQVRNPWIWATE